MSFRESWSWGIEKRITLGWDKPYARQKQVGKSRNEQDQPRLTTTLHHFCYFLACENNCLSSLLAKETPLAARRKERQMFSQASYASMLETNRGCSELVEAGDYKFHRGDQNPQTDIKFSQILHSFELTQHVSVATNKRNYTLDSIFHNYYEVWWQTGAKKVTDGFWISWVPYYQIISPKLQIFLQNYLFLLNKYFFEKHHVNKPTDMDESVWDFQMPSP